MVLAGDDGANALRFDRQEKLSIPCGLRNSKDIPNNGRAARSGVDGMGSQDVQRKKQGLKISSISSLLWIDGIDSMLIP